MAYLIAYAFHPAVIPFIIFRIILLSKNRWIIFFTKLGALIYSFFTPVILSFFNSIYFISPLLKELIIIFTVKAIMTHMLPIDSLYNINPYILNN